MSIVFATDGEPSCHLQYIWNNNMGSETGSMSQDGQDTDDEEEYEEVGGGNRLLGFMFGNVDNSGELDVDYLDEDAKEHIVALADKLGPSLTDIDLSGKATQSSAPSADEDYDEKAEDAVDYEDIDEQYEGPEIEAVTEEDYLLPKRDFLSADVSVAAFEHKSSAFDDENYDEDEDYEKEAEEVVSNSVVQVIASPGLPLDPNYENQSMVAEKDSEFQAIMSPAEQDINDAVASTKENCFEDFEHLDSVETEIVAAVDGTGQEEEPSLQVESYVDSKNPSALPILCIEDGMAILRFSEIFGVHEPLKKREKRECRYSIPKDKYTFGDVSQIVEEDEEAFLIGSSQVSSFSKSSLFLKDDTVYKDDNEKFDKCGVIQSTGSVDPLFDHGRRDLCASARPMRSDLALDLCMEWRSDIAHKFYLLDQQNWEDGIIWDNSPTVSDNTVESCQLSGPDSESIINEEKELSLSPKIKSLITKLYKMRRIMIVL
ncbi:hypothetical protein Nepgr_004872 [Nepenthes gracilis]|uniref:TAFII-230 TBP-binding domain-containing protein n=1 Tax=Nepenthes gracilis TaxID=150966 RepID=A0AAD3S235_NEPGR|nr:hypothetical protein Nepgr_004872 [Nepenthes gracilis]